MIGRRDLLEMQVWQFRVFWSESELVLKRVSGVEVWWSE